MKERAEAKIKFRKHAPLMKKWIWVLFWLIIIQTVSDIFEQDFVANWMPLVNQISEYLTIVCSFLYAFVLLKLSPVSEGYRIAGVCFLITDVLNIIKLLAESSNGLKIVLSLVNIILLLVALYNEYMAHAFAVHGIDDYLASDWEALWKWYIAIEAAVFVSIIIISLRVLPLIIVLTLIIVLLATCGLSVYKMILLYRTADLFVNYKPKQ